MFCPEEEILKSKKFGGYGKINSQKMMILCLESVALCVKKLHGNF